MSQVRVHVRFSNTGFYDRLESTVVIFALPPAGSEITFETMAYHWDDQGGLIHTSIHESSPLDTYREVGHLDWDPKEPNVLWCIDTNNEDEDRESGNDNSVNSQSSRTYRFVFMA